MTALDSPSAALLAQAAEFLVDLQAEELQPRQQEAIRARLDTWRTADPEHEKAWQRLMAMSHRLAPLNTHSTRGRTGAILSRAAVKADRRRAVKQLTGMLIASSAGLAIWRQSDTAPVWLAALGSDTATGIGERRSLQLPDGSDLQLNADSTVALQFSADRQIVRLISGELYIRRTSSSLRTLALTVTTRHGRIEARSARFGVRQREQAASEVFVDEGLVELATTNDNDMAIHSLNAGESRVFDYANLGQVRASDPDMTAWTRGMLIAHEMPLVQLLAELSLFRQGYLGCDPAISQLRVTGTFPLRTSDDTDRALRMLVAEHGLQARYVTRYWTRLSAAA